MIKKINNNLHPTGDKRFIKPKMTKNRRELLEKGLEIINSKKRSSNAAQDYAILFSDGTLKETRFPSCYGGLNSKYGLKADFSKNPATITTAAPVKNKNNQIIGVLIANVNLTAIETIIKNSVLGQTGYLYLIDLQNKPIANSLGAANFSPANPDKVLKTSKTLPDFNWNLVAEWPLKEVYAIIGDVVIKTIFTIIIVGCLVFL